MLILYSVIPVVARSLKNRLSAQGMRCVGSAESENEVNMQCIQAFYVCLCVCSCVCLYACVSLTVVLCVLNIDRLKVIS